MSIIKTDEIQSRTSGNRVVLPDVNNYPPFRNLIINGDMSIDQRNGTSTINATGVTYNVDRFLGRGVSSAGVFTLVQDTDAPERFTNSLKATVTTADSSIASGSSYRVQQFVEGKNSSNLYWGNSSAQTVTLSFYVKSSVTGTFGGNLANGDFNRFNVFSYTINSANTWERKTISITGDTSGTWLTTNGIGIRINWSLGAGSTLLDSTGSWGSSTKEGVTGQTNLIATNSATWRITGVQLEVGDSATPFEFLPFDVNFKRCQRYFETTYNHGTAIGTSTEQGTSALNGLQTGSKQVRSHTIIYKTEKRATPTVTVMDTLGQTGKTTTYNSSGVGTTNISFDGVITNGTTSFNWFKNSTTLAGYQYHYTADGEL